MTKLPIVSAKELERILFRLDFILSACYKNLLIQRSPRGARRSERLDGHHKGHDITRPLLRTILREITVDLDTFNNLLNR